MTTRQLKLEVLYKVWNKESQQMEEQRRKELTVDIVRSPLEVFIELVLYLLGDIKFPLVRILFEGWKSPFETNQWLSVLDLDYLACSMAFRVLTKVVPADFGALYRPLVANCNVQLSFLHLKFVPLNRESEKEFGKMMDSQTHLETLVMTPVMADDGTIWLDKLKASRSIRTLSVAWWAEEGNERADHPVRAFANGLPDCTSLRYLLIAPLLTMGLETFEALRDGLQKNTTIQELMLSGHGYDHAGNDRLCSLVSSLNPMVKSLRLPRMDIDEEPFEKYELLLDHLEESTSIETLDFSHAHMSETNFELLVQKVLRMKHLRSLNLSTVHTELTKKTISRRSIKTLCEHLRCNDRLLTLEIGYDSDCKDCKDEVDFYLQRNHCKDLLRNSNLGEWPHILSQVEENGWRYLSYFLLRQRVDLLLHTKSSLKRPSKLSTPLPARKAPKTR